MNRAVQELKKEVIIKGLHFICLTEAHPEEYKILDNTGKETGYIRLRHHKLVVFYKKLQDYSNFVSSHIRVYFNQSYITTVKGDGSFYDDDERHYHLSKIANEILEIEEEKTLSWWEKIIDFLKKMLKK
jgi:hypothetical protein